MRRCLAALLLMVACQFDTSADGLSAVFDPPPPIVSSTDAPGPEVADASPSDVGSDVTMDAGLPDAGDESDARAQEQGDCAESETCCDVLAACCGVLQGADRAACEVLVDAGRSIDCQTQLEGVFATLCP